MSPYFLCVLDYVSMYVYTHLLVCDEDTVGVLMLTSNLVVGEQVNKLLHKVQHLQTVCKLNLYQTTSTSTRSTILHLFMPGYVGHGETGCL